MSARKSTLFYGVLIALSSLVVGMVLASKLGMSPASFAGSLTVPPTNSAPLTGTIDATTFRTIANEAGPAVVSIRTTSTRQADGGLEELFGFSPFRNQAPQRRPQQPQLVTGAGSGFVIDKTGYILTNNHVVEDATKVEVKFGSSENGPWLAAKVIGTDVLTDTALIQLTEMPDQPLPVSRFGDSAQLAQGDWVMAIGNPFALSNTVTVGVVSAVGRSQQTAVSGRSEDMIQTDAAINRGNSGGPLLNIRGEVVGINTQILSDNSGGNIGIGFAVPINTVRSILPQLEKGKVVRGRIGVSVSKSLMTKDIAQDLGLTGTNGALVSVIPDGPAKTAGIQVGDVIVEFNGKPVKDSSDLVGMVTATTPGTTVPVKIVRARKTMTVNVKVEELDLASEQAQAAQQPRPGAQPDEPKETGFGMSIEGLTPTLARRLGVPAGAGGAVVSDIDQGGAAEAAGMRPGDVIVRINDLPVTTLDQVSKALDAVPSNRTARIVVLQGGRESLVLVRKK
jgi:serine protease Do